MASRILSSGLFRPMAIAATLAVGGIAVSLAIPSAGEKNLLLDAPPGFRPPKKVFGFGPAFISLPLESGVMVNHNTRKLRFKLPEDNSVSGIGLTAALLTLSWPKGYWLPVARPYTPVSASDEKGHLELLVKQYPNGKQSTHLHNLQPGQSLLFAAAIPGYKWKANRFSHITLIAGGAGITPIYQLASGILRDPEDKTSMTLVFGVNSDADVLLREEFEEFEKRFPDRFRAVYTVSHPQPGSKYRKGYVSKALLEEVAPKSEMVFVCGPPAMEKALTGARGVSGVLQELGYTKNQIHKF